jgi:hypothetical protein
MRKESPVKLASPALPQQALADLAASRATGALHVGSDPPGLLHFVDGHVTHAASPMAPGVGDLLTIGGRIPVSVWQSAMESGMPDNRVGAALIEQGHLTRGELELCVLGVIYDAAYFVLAERPVPVRFEVDRPHWLGAVTGVPVDALTAEIRRRRAMLTDILDDPGFDRAPVVPVTRVRRDRIRLSAVQWEIVLHADGQRTPTGMARHLGRAAYACLQEVRRLAADGLVRLPAPADTATTPADTATTPAQDAPVRAADPAAVPAANAGPATAPRRTPNAGPGLAPTPALCPSPALGLNLAPEPAPNHATDLAPNLATDRVAGAASNHAAAESAAESGIESSSTVELPSPELIRPAVPEPPVPVVPVTVQQRPVQQRPVLRRPPAVPPPEPAEAMPEPPPGRFRLPRRRPSRPRDDAEPVPPADEALLHRLRSALKGMA